MQIDNAHSVGVTGVSWAPATPPGSLVSAQGASAPDKRLASSGCDNAVKVCLVGASAARLYAANLCTKTNMRLRGRCGAGQMPSRRGSRKASP